MNPSNLFRGGLLFKCCYFSVRTPECVTVCICPSSFGEMFAMEAFSGAFSPPLQVNLLIAYLMGSLQGHKRGLRMPLVSLPDNGALCLEEGPHHPICGGLSRQRRPQPGCHVVRLTCGQIKPRCPLPSDPVIHGAAPFLTSPTGAVNVLHTERSSSPGELEPFISLKDHTLCFGEHQVVSAFFPSRLSQ